VRAALRIAALIVAAALPGCVVVQTGVTNPIPGMTTVAVAPFINLSAERSVDGRRFALAYHAELQKVPGYQVIPVGVTEQAMVDLGLDLDGPGDALKLAKALGADAVVIGAVTDYTPYYPPRIGLQVSWYAPEPWRFSPGIPTDPKLNEAVRVWRFAAHDRRGSPTKTETAPQIIVRAQSPDAAANVGRVVETGGVRGANPIQLTGIETGDVAGDEASGPLLIPPAVGHSEPPQTAGRPETPQVKPATAEEPDKAAEPGAIPAQAVSMSAICPLPAPVPGTVAACPPTVGIGPPIGPAGPYDPREPIMSYTRLFDGSDAELTALLRDYVLLSGDLRSGGWEAYLHRTEDFIRFTAHRMIVEMLTLHGGESRRRYVWLLRHDHG
jgi:hypothetical protein